MDPPQKWLTGFPVTGNKYGSDCPAGKATGRPAGETLIRHWGLFEVSRDRGVA
jgi:hypothetical protein